MKKTIMFLFITSLLTACGSEQAEVSQSATTKDNPVTLNETESVNFGSSKTRVVSIVDEQDREQWIEYINLSSINKFSDASSTRNFFTTPYHEISLFTLLALGAEGESLAEIKDYLDFELPFFDVQSEFFLSAVNSFDLALRPSAQGSAFSSSYVLFGQNDYAFSSEFLDKTVMYFGAELQEVDFINDPQDVLTQYTEYLTSMSQQLLHEEGGRLFDPSGIVDNKLLLSHMSILDAKWQTPFSQQNTMLKEFTLLDKSNVEVPMMQLTLDTQYYTNNSEFLVALPTHDPAWTLYVMSSNTLDKHSSFKTNLDLDKFYDMQQQTVLSQVQLSLPSFSMKNDDRAASNVGLLSSIYDKESADLSLMSANLSSELFVKNIGSVSALVVSEAGIKIGSEIRVNIEPKPLPEILNVNSSYGAFFTSNVYDSYFLWNNESIIKTATLNSPFVFFVYHNRTGTVMYSGQVINPAQ